MVKITDLWTNLREKVQPRLKGRKIFLLSDFGVPENVLSHDIGHFRVGGAEQHDAALVHYMSKFLEEKVEVRKCNQVFADQIDPQDLYIISNHTVLGEAVKIMLQEHENYIIYEHDHQYCIGRNPYVFYGLQIPLQAQLNIQFYANAKAVVCMTRKHQMVVASNVTAKYFTNIGGTFYFQNELDYMKALGQKRDNNEIDRKRGVAAIYGHEHPLKGMANSMGYCYNNNIAFDVIPSKPTKKEFLDEMARYDLLVFMPLQPETCCRIVTEAKMLGLSVETKNIVGATGEAWYNFSSENIIQDLGEPLRYRAISAVLNTLTNLIPTNDYCYT